LFRPRKFHRIISREGSVDKHSTFCPGTYVTPTPPKTYIIGVEVIVYIEIIENCKTLGLTETGLFPLPPSVTLLTTPSHRIHHIHRLLLREANLEHRSPRLPLLLLRPVQRRPDLQRLHHCLGNNLQLPTAILHLHSPKPRHRARRQQLPLHAVNLPCCYRRVV
jgi:hypothetical protein